MASEDEKNNENKSLAKSEPKVEANDPSHGLMASNTREGAISEVAPLLIVEPLGGSAQKVKRHFGTDSMVRIMEINRSAIAVAARRLSPCVLIVSVTSSNEVVQVVNILKALRNDLKSSKVKLIVFSPINNSGIIRLFESVGSKEYVVEPIAEKALFHKMGLHIKALKAQRSQLRSQEIARQNQQQRKNEKDGQKDSQKKITDETTIGEAKRTEATEFAKDVWVFKKNKPVRQGGNWTIRMKGPPPGSGEWIEVDDEKGGRKWRFAEKEVEDEDPNLTPDELKTRLEEKSKKGGWEFEGEKPQHQGGEWNFTSPEPQLAYINQDGKKESSKVNTQNGQISVTEDSVSAQKNLEKKEKEEVIRNEIRKRGIYAGVETKDQSNAKKGKGTAEPKKKTKEDEAREELERMLGIGNEKDKNNKTPQELAEKEEATPNRSGQESVTDSPEPLSKSDESAEAPLELGSSKKFGKARKTLGLGDSSSHASAELETESDSDLNSDSDAVSDADADAEAQGLSSGDRNFLKKKKKRNEQEKEATTSESLLDRKSKKRRDSQQNAPEENSTLTSETSEEGDEDSSPDRIDSNPFSFKKKKKQKQDGAIAAADSSEEPQADSSEEESPEQVERNPFGFKKKKRSKEDPKSRGLIGIEDEAEPIQGKDEAKTLHIENSEWQGHDLTPDELKERAAWNQKKKKNAGETSQANASESTADGLTEGFFKEGKTGEPGDAGAWSKHNTSSDKKSKWGGSDSDQEGEAKADADKMVEIETPLGKLNNKTKGNKNKDTNHFEELKMPSPLSLAIVLADSMSLTSMHGFDVLSLFCRRVTDKVKGIAMTLIAFENNGQIAQCEGRVLASTGSVRALASVSNLRESFSEEIFKKIAKTGEFIRSDDKKDLYCPIRNKKGAVVGLLVIEAKDIDKILNVESIWSEALAAILRNQIEVALVQARTAQEAA